MQTPELKANPDQYRKVNELAMTFEKAASELSQLSDVLEQNNRKHDQLLEKLTDNSKLAPIDTALEQFN